MIIFLSEGRLGNQIFQYAFLKKIQKNNECLMVSGFEELLDVFEVDGLLNLSKKNRWIKLILFSISKPLFYYFAEKKIISSVSVSHEDILKKYRRESTSYTKVKGFFSFITFVKLGFFQSENFFDKDIVNKLKVNKLYLNKADKFLKELPKKTSKIFVHIRRGDYKNFNVYGKSTLLPMSYFKEQIAWFTKNKKNPLFIFFSDEPEFIQEQFHYLDNKIISNDNNFGTDFAIMTKCDSAILSPSSFGWWGAYLMTKRDVVFVPKYWLGFNSFFEYHRKATPSFAREVIICHMPQ